jgi:L-amino acid N-acyltransferase YncA
MNLQLQQFKTIKLSDPFFDTLKSDYEEFEDWFAKKSEDQAYVFEGENGSIEGFLYLKTEDGAVTDTSPPLPPAHRIKVGTLKINAHGTKLGERFLKKIFDHAISENAEEIYLTVFEKHTPLVALLKKYGFEEQASKSTPNGTELVLVKVLYGAYRNPILSYPLINTSGTKTHILSIYPDWHTRLLPDSILNNESATIVQDISHTNSIHKIYLAAMSGLDSLKSGDVLLIYRTSDGKGPAHFRSVVTSICVVEEYQNINNFSSEKEFLDYCRPYSVFTENELKSFWSRHKYPHIIRFTYNVALKRRITRGELIEEIGLDSKVYPGFMSVTKDQFLNIVQKSEINESLIVN